MNENWQDADLEIELWNDTIGRTHYRLIMALEGEKEPTKMVLSERQAAFNCIVTFLIGRRHFNIVQASRIAQKTIETAHDRLAEREFARG